MQKLVEISSSAKTTGSEPQKVDEGCENHFSSPAQLQVGFLVGATPPLRCLLRRAARDVGWQALAFLPSLVELEAPPWAAR